MKLIIEAVGIPAFILIMAVGAAIALPRLWEIIRRDSSPISTNADNNPDGLDQPTGPIARTAPDAYAGRTLASEPIDWEGLHRAYRPGRAR